MDKQATPNALLNVDVDLKLYAWVFLPAGFREVKKMTEDQTPSSLVSIPLLKYKGFILMK